MKNLITVFLMSVMTLFTFDVNSQLSTPFEVGHGTGNPFDENDFTSTVIGADYGSGITGEIYGIGFDGSAEIEYTPSDVNLNGVTDLKIEYTFDGSVDIDSIQILIDGLIKKTIDNPSLSGYTTLNISGDSFSLKVFGIGNGTIIYDKLILTDVSTSTTGIDENDISDDFNIYSYNNNLVVKTNEFVPYNVTVYTMSGQVVLNENNNGNMETQLYVPSGVYFVKVTSSTGVLNKKIAIR